MPLPSVRSALRLVASCDTTEDEPLLPVSFSTSKTRQRSHISSEEYLQTVASRVLYSQACGAFYLSLLAASVTEILWIVHPSLDPYHWIIDPSHCCRLSYPRSRLFLLIETYLTLGLSAETALRLLWQRSAFWTHKGNVFDAAVCLLSLLSFTLYLFEISKDLDVIVLIVMGTWVALRLARLVAVAKNLAQQRSTTEAKRLDVDFEMTTAGVGLGEYAQPCSPVGASNTPAVLFAMPEEEEAHAELAEHHEQHFVSPRRALCDLEGGAHASGQPGGGQCYGGGGHVALNRAPALGGPVGLVTGSGGVS